MARGRRVLLPVHACDLASRFRFCARGRTRRGAMRPAALLPLLSVLSGVDSVRLWNSGV